MAKWFCVGTMAGALSFYIKLRSIAPVCQYECDTHAGIPAIDEVTTGLRSHDFLCVKNVEVNT